LSDKNILMQFLEMPLYRTEEVFKKFSSIPGTSIYGSGLEKFLFIRGNRKNRVLLIAHADTYWDYDYDEAYTGQCFSGVAQEINEDNGIVTNKNGGLGADDRAGCAIAWLLKDLGHSILITSGEEHGSRGSHYLMREHTEIADEINNYHQFAIQLDRRNGTDFKCYDVGTDSFRAYVQKTTGYSEPDKYSSTDIKTICRDICGVNLSIGYYNEHSSEEYLVIKEWENTLILLREWLSLEDLPLFKLRD